MACFRGACANTEMSGSRCPSKHAYRVWRSQRRGAATLGDVLACQLCSIRLCCSWRTPRVVALTWQAYPPHCVLHMISLVLQITTSQQHTSPSCNRKLSLLFALFDHLALSCLKQRRKRFVFGKLNILWKPHLKYCNYCIKQIVQSREMVIAWKYLNFIMRITTHFSF